MIEYLQMFTTAMCLTELGNRERHGLGGGPAKHPELWLRAFASYPAEQIKLHGRAVELYALRRRLKQLESKTKRAAHENSAVGNDRRRVKSGSEDSKTKRKRRDELPETVEEAARRRELRIKNTEEERRSKHTAEHLADELRGALSNKIAELERRYSTKHRKP